MRALEKAVAERDSAKIFELSAETLRRTDPMKFVDELLSYLRDRILEVGVRSPEFPLLSDFFESVSAAYVRARLSPDPMFVIETTLAKVAYGPVTRVAYDDIEMPAKPKATPVSNPTNRNADRAPLPEPVPVAKPDIGQREDPFPEDQFPISEYPFDDFPPPSEAPIPEPVHSSPTRPAPSAPSPIREVPVVAALREEAPQAESPSETPSVSVAELVAKLKEIPKTTTLVIAMKNSPRCLFVDASTYLVVTKNSIDAGVLGKPEAQAALSKSLESLCGRPISIRIESPK